MAKVLLVIDMQNDFIDGSLGTEEAVKIVQNVSNKIDEYHRNHNRVIFTRDTHGKDYLNTFEGKNLPIEHCIKGTKGWEISDLLEVMEGDIILDKPTFGCLELPKYIDENDEVEIIGLCTNICVDTNGLLLRTFFPNSRIIVDSKCCAGTTPEEHEAALKVMRSCQIEVI